MSSWHTRQSTSTKNPPMPTKKPPTTKSTKIRSSEPKIGAGDAPTRSFHLLATSPPGAMGSEVMARAWWREHLPSCCSPQGPWRLIGVP